jgi:O-methyltransferase
MVGHIRLQNIRETLENVTKEGIPGDVVELGVWRGGAVIYASAVLLALGQGHRNIHVFDAFESLPGYGASSHFLSVSEESVKHNFEKYGLLSSNVKFYKGLFQDTVPIFAQGNPDVSLSVMRIDGNFYGSYQAPLYYLYELVPVGGRVIFDDVLSHPRVMQAWLDFKEEQGLPEVLIHIDDHSAWFMKKKAITIKWRYYREDEVY